MVTSTTIKAFCSTVSGKWCWIAYARSTPNLPSIGDVDNCLFITSDITADSEELDAFAPGSPGRSTSHPHSPYYRSNYVESNRTGCNRKYTCYLGIHIPNRIPINYPQCSSYSTCYLAGNLWFESRLDTILYRIVVYPQEDRKEGVRKLKRYHHSLRWLRPFKTMVALQIPKDYSRKNQKKKGVCRAL